MTRAPDNTPRSFVIAIDGPAASGKGTLAHRIAEHYDFARLDSGKLYRAVAKRIMDIGCGAGDRDAAARAAAEISPEDLDNQALGEDSIAHVASQIAAHEEVRDALLDFQRRFAHTPPGGKRGAVIDGRDIGTVVCPGADVKIFVTADIEVRADRRLKELRARGLDSIKARVLQDMRERDARDIERSASPLRQAEDAHLLDTTEMDADQAFEATRVVIDSLR